MLTTPLGDAWADRLSEYLDGELGLVERRQLEAHLVECAECRDTLDGLRRVVDAAGALTPRPAAADLWGGIAARLEPSSHGADTAERHAGTARGFLRVTFTMPQLIAAALALALVSGWVARRLATPPPVVEDTAEAVRAPEDGVEAPGELPVMAASFADAQYDAAVADLERALREDRGRLDATTIAVVSDNLALIDRAISEARRALETDPANGYVGAHLIQTRRAKLDLLRYAAGLTADFEPGDRISGRAGLPGM